MHQDVPRCIKNAPRYPAEATRGEGATRRAAVTRRDSRRHGMTVAYRSVDGSMRIHPYRTLHRPNTGFLGNGVPRNGHPATFAGRRFVFGQEEAMDSATRIDLFTLRAA